LWGVPSEPRALLVGRHDSLLKIGGNTNMIVAYEFYRRDSRKKYQLIGVLPEMRKNPERITKESVLNWGQKYFGNHLNLDDMFFIEVLKRSSEFGLQIMGDISLIDLEELKEHEQIRPDYLEELKNEILSDGILKMPIAVDKKTFIILDGHHRLHALKEMGCKRIPVILFDYESPEIEVLPHREGEIVTKEMIIQTALAGRSMPPKTSKHMILIEGELEHISILETVINIPLEKLR
jgi:hypothetical protein